MTAGADQARARNNLAAILRTLRPDWDSPGIVAALEAAHRDRHPLGHIAAAAIDAALTPTTKTPGGIRSRLDNGWTGANAEPSQPPRRTARQYPQLVTCRTCGHVHTPSEPCHRRARPETITAAATAARTAIRHTDHTEGTP